MEKKTTILFQGDSITDADRNREIATNLGKGYVNEINLLLSADGQNKNIEITNRGISGDRVIDLSKRWDKDCISINPAVVSILIGINDCWRRYDNNDPTTADEFKKDYRYILNQVKERTDAKIILCEPFVLPIPEDRIQWREDLDPKIKAVRELSKEFDALYLPLDKIFREASVSVAPILLAEDGVHPTPRGHNLIAKEWIKVYKKLNL